MKDNYKKAMEVWEVPEEFYEAAVPMYRGKRSRRGCFSRVIREMYWKNARGTKAAAHFTK